MIREGNSKRQFYLYLRLMGCVAMSAVVSGHPYMTSMSSRFLKALTDGASMTDCGSLFHSLMTRMLKKFCRNVVRHLGLYNVNECPLSQLVASANSKSKKSILSFPVSILNVSIKSPRNLRLSSV